MKRNLRTYPTDSLPKLNLLCERERESQIDTDMQIGGDAHNGRRNAKLMHRPNDRQVSLAGGADDLPVCYLQTLWPSVSV